MRGWGLALALFVAAAGCDAGEEPEADLTAFGEVAGKEDGFSALEIGLGEAVELSVRAKRGEPLSPKHAKALQFQVPPGQAFAVVMRGVDPMDPYLELFDEGESIAVSKFNQPFAPMAAQQDAVVFGQPAVDTTYIVVAADVDLAADARFRVDVIALTSPLPDTDINLNYASRIVVQLLREQEDLIAESLESGAFLELGDGTVKPNRIDGASPLEFGETKRKAAAVNELRRTYFDDLCEESSAADRERTTAVILELWDELR